MSFSADYFGRKYCSTPKYGASLPTMLITGSTIPKVSLKKRNAKKRFVKRTENKFKEQTMKNNSIANFSETVILQDSESEYDQQKSYLVDISGDEHSLQKCDFDNVADNERISQKLAFDNESRVERLSWEVEDLGIFANAKAGLFVDNDSEVYEIGPPYKLIETSDNSSDNSYRHRTPERVRACADETCQNNLLSAIKKTRTRSRFNDGKVESSDQRIKTYAKAVGKNRSVTKYHDVTFLISDSEDSLSSDECEILKYVEPDPSFKSLSVIADMLWDDYMEDEPLIDKHRAVDVIKKDKKRATTAKKRSRRENNEKRHVVRERNSSIAGSSTEVDIEPIIIPHREKSSRKKRLAPETQMKQEFATTAIDPYDVGDNVKKVGKRPHTKVNNSSRKMPSIISCRILTTKYRLVTKQQ